jgi:hypothetical protein
VNTPSDEAGASPNASADASSPDAGSTGQAGGADSSMSSEAAVGPDASPASDASGTGAADSATMGSGDSSGGGADAGVPTNFTCNQVLGFTLSSEWYNAGFERAAGITDSRWQQKFRDHGYITEWANPSSLFWGNDAANGAIISSACTQNTLSPDHVVLNILSWTITTQQEWATDITAAVNNLKVKYPNLRRVDLMTIIRGPNDALCPTPPATGETIVISQTLDDAMAQVAAQFPNFVFVAPKFEAPNCGVFNGGGPHLTTAGNTTMAPVIAAYLATTQ